MGVFFHSIYIISKYTESVKRAKVRTHVRGVGRRTFAQGILIRFATLRTLWAVAILYGNVVLLRYILCVWYSI